MHAILDKYATQQHPKVLAWLAHHPRFVFHFTPTSASWLNAVEGKSRDFEGLPPHPPYHSLFLPSLKTTPSFVRVNLFSILSSW